VIQVPAWPGRGESRQAAMTAGRSRSKCTVKPLLRMRLARLRRTFTDAGKSRARGSGEHHGTGGAPVHGKMPWR